MGIKRTRSRSRARNEVVPASGLVPVRKLKRDLSGVNELCNEIFETDIYNQSNLAPTHVGTQLESRLSYPLRFDGRKFVINPFIQTETELFRDGVTALLASEIRRFTILGRQGELNSLLVHTQQPAFTIRITVDGTIFREIDLLTAYDDGLDHASEQYGKLINWNTVDADYIMLFLTGVKFRTALIVEVENAAGVGRTIEDVELVIKYHEAKRKPNAVGIVAATI